jgi:peptide/nickel transport system substrate-binding protein
MDTFQGVASQVGVRISLKSAPFGTVIGNSLPCKPTQSSCADQMQYWGQGWVFSPDYYPSGENFLFSTAEINSSNYDSPTADKLIEESTTGAGLGAYESYISKQVPLLWMPVQDSQVSAISTSLHGVGVQNPILNTNPETWYISNAR